MAELFVKQAKQYAGTRPTYPPELFHFVASRTPGHDLVWDVGTGSGQAAQSNVVGDGIAAAVSRKKREQNTQTAPTPTRAPTLTLAIFPYVLYQLCAGVYNRGFKYAIVTSNRTV